LQHQKDFVNAVYSTDYFQANEGIRTIRCSLLEK
jgi:hypothetical protein